MTESLTSILETPSIKLAGRASFVLSAGGYIVNQISQMEFIQPWVVIATGIFSIIYLVFKIVMIRINFIEKQEERALLGKRKIKFFGWMSRKKTSKK